MISMNRLSQIAAVLGFPVGIFLGAFAYKSSWDIAEATGSLDKAELEISIGQPIDYSTTVKIILGAPDLSEKGVTTISKLPFQFESVGSKSIEDLSITFQYHKTLRRGQLEALPFAVAGAMDPNTAKRSFSQTSTDSYATYTIDRLNPGVSIGINEPIYLTPTFDYDPSSSTDSSTITTPFGDGDILRVGLSVHGKDMHLQSVPIELIIVEVDDKNDLKNKGLKSLVLRTQERVRSSTSFIGYLGLLLFSESKERVHVVYLPKEKEVEHHQGTIRFYTGKPIRVTFLVNLITWRQLFG
jgi:hypothetical protein